MASMTPPDFQESGPRRRPGAGALAALLFQCGFFTLVAQAVLVREFLVLYQGSELALGMFYFAWLGWIAAGALLFLPVRGRFFASGRFLPGNWLPGALIALPVSALVEILALRVGRIWLGVSAAEVMPPGVLLGGTLAATALIGLPAGFVFALACAATERYREGRMGWVGLLFGLEALGSFAGGLVYTFGMAGRFPAIATIAILTGLAGAHLAVWAGVARFRTWRAALCAGCVMVAPAIFYGWSAPGLAQLDALDAAVFERLRPGLKWERDADTRFQRLELARRDQQYTLFSNGRVAYSFPNRIDNQRAAALVMVQNPQGVRDILVMGSADPGFLSEILRYRGVQRVDAVDLDPQGLEIARPFLGEAERRALNDPRLHLFFTDPRAYVNRSEKEHAYDLIVVSAPDPISASVNRLFTREFFEGARRLLRDGGILATGVTSSENYLGREMSAYAGSIVATARSMFPFVALTPGDRMSILASDRPGRVSVDARELAARHRSLYPAAGLFNPDGFDTMLPPRDVERTTQRFARIEAPLNTDARPISYYLGLAVWNRLAGASPGRAGIAWEGRGLVFFLTLLGIALLGRLFHAAETSRLGATATSPLGGDRFNAVLTVGGLGFAGMSASVLLSLAYQSAVGMLYGRVALLAALFMVGLGWGAVVGGRIGWTGFQARCVLMGFLAGLGALLTALGWYLGTAGWQSGILIMAALVSAGTLTGMAFSAAAGVFADAEGRTGAWLDAADHLGASLGAFAAGVLLIPILGFRSTALAAAAVVAALLVLHAQSLWLERRRAGLPQGGIASVPSGGARPWAWILGALLVMTYCAGWTIHSSGVAAQERLATADSSGKARGSSARGRTYRISASQLARWAPGVDWRQESEPFPHWKGAKSGKEAGGMGVEKEDAPTSRVAFATDQTAPHVWGYAGPITLGIDMDGETVRGVHLLRSRETPSYTEALEPWVERLAGKSVREPVAPGRNIDGITGATVSCQAAAETLNRSVREGGGALLGLKIESGERPAAAWARSLAAPAPVAALAAFLLLPFVYLWAGDRLRILYLLLVAAVLGGFLNRVFTMVDIGNVSLGNLPSAANAAGAVMLAGTVLVMVLWGNLVCGHLCPFGALQELVSRLVSACLPSDLRIPRFRLSRRLRALRDTRYLLAAVALGGFWIAWGDLNCLMWSPLETCFARNKSFLLWVLASACLAATLVVPRFFCLFLCPAGAVLSAFSRFSLLRGTRFFRKTEFAACDLGATPEHPGDCLHCNRCLLMKDQPVRGARRREKAVLAAFVLAMGLLAVVYSVQIRTAPASAALPGESAAASGTPGGEQRGAGAEEARKRARDVDTRAVDEALRSGRLSDHEAMHYEPLAPPGEAEQ